ncbi:Chlorophyll a/b-binding family protein [Heracleum sosnowskyi]|uniref:Chlorophyll a/b-binding family protein n=1 Tax=Heracleum sosnowskyi TaxID=360622 RepID=A0AAD8MXV3_9APIA|nr:Chlorophyll a/b-binding family protein [Heracleum sosnowskyi]
MAGQWGDHSSVSTSIALLQERFTQLQKMKEKREEKEHQRLIYSEPCHTMPATPFEHAKMNFQKDRTFLSRTPQQESSPVPLGNFQSMRMHSPNLWSHSATSAEITARNPSYNYDKWDVDTTLHL